MTEEDHKRMEATITPPGVLRDVFCAVIGGIYANPNMGFREMEKYPDWPVETAWKVVKVMTEPHDAK